MATASILAACTGLWWLVALSSGWRALAARFTADRVITGERFVLCCVAAGWGRWPVTYGMAPWLGRGLAFATVGDASLHIALLPPLSLFHPALSTPWLDISTCERIQGIVSSRTELRVAGVTQRLILPGALGRAAFERWNSRFDGDADDLHGGSRRRRTGG